MPKNLFFYVCLLFSIFLVTSVWAWPIPDSGQDKCYDDQGNEITCPSPGEPFYGQDANYSINPRSYTKLDAQGNALPDSATEWVMVKDNVTGLIWEVKTDDGGISDKDDQYDWYNATDEFITELNSQNFGGHSDWRMPTIKELASLADLGNTDPAIETKYFPNTVVSSHYWSSTTYADDEDYAWRVVFGSGSGSSYSHLKSHSYYVRAVRGGQSESFDDLIISGDGTVTDLNTGLTWQRATNNNKMNWSEALDYCENLNLAGQTDWRLPTREELRSIVNYSNYGPAIDEQTFPDTAPYYYSQYWSSTTYAHYENLRDHAWTVNFNNGDASSFNKSIRYVSYYVRAVRSIQLDIVSDLILLPQSGIYPLKVTLEVIVIGGETPYSYHFDFGDGNTLDSDNSKVSHTYTKAGTFKITCTVTDNEGNTATSDPVSITITPPVPVISDNSNYND